MKAYWRAIGIGFLLGIFVLGVLFVALDRIAYIVWARFRLEHVALILANEDAVLARRVGNYYFNVWGSGIHNLEKAKEVYREALKRNPNIERVHYQLGRIHFIEGDFFRALREINKEIEINPELPNSYYVLGLIYGFRGFPGDMERAEAGFAESVERIPDGWAGYNDLAWIYIKQEKYDEAKETIQSAFEKMSYLKERNVWLWTALGVVYLNTGYYNEARDAFQRVEDIVGTITPEYFWSAYPGNDPRNAEEAFRQFRSTLYFNLGIVYEKLEEWEESIKHYKKYITLLPEGPFPKREEVESKIDELYVHLQ